jgi:hypothetical protein
MAQIGCFEKLNDELGLCRTNWLIQISLTKSRCSFGFCPAGGFMGMHLTSLKLFELTS